MSELALRFGRECPHSSSGSPHCYWSHMDMCSRRETRIWPGPVSSWAFVFLYASSAMSPTTTAISPSTTTATKYPDDGSGEPGQVNLAREVPRQVNPAVVHMEPLRSTAPPQEPRPDAHRDGRILIEHRVVVVAPVVGGQGRGCERSDAKHGSEAEPKRGT